MTHSFGGFNFDAPNLTSDLSAPSESVSGLWQDFFNSGAYLDSNQSYEMPMEVHPLPQRQGEGRLWPDSPDGDTIHAEWGRNDQQWWNMDLGGFTHLPDILPSPLEFTSMGPLTDISSSSLHNQDRSAAMAVPLLGQREQEGSTVIVEAAGSNAPASAGQTCPLCGTTLQSKFAYHLQQHQRSKACRRAVGKQLEDEENAKISHLLSSGTTIGGPPLRRPLLQATARARASAHTHTRSESLPNIAFTSATSAPPSQSALRAQSVPTWPELTSNAEEDDSPVDARFGAHIEENMALPKDLTSSRECPGILLDWPKPVFLRFPWQMLADQKDSLTFSVSRLEANGIDTEIWVRAKGCSQVTRSGGRCCSDCEMIPVGTTLVNARKRALEHVPVQLNHQYMTYEQLDRSLTGTRDELNETRQKLRQARQALDNAHQRLDDYKCLVAALAEHDVVRLRHLIKQALKRQVSVKVILARINNAITDVYHARQYNQNDLDIAYLVRHLGGRKCLFAVSKALGLPSVNTVAKLCKRISIIPSVGAPSRAEVSHNLNASFPIPDANHPAQHVPIEKCGYTVMLDGISLSQHIRVMQDTNMMVGFCREHAEGHDLCIRNFDSVIKVHDAVHGDIPSLHYAREATVAVFAPFRRDNYHPLPALVSPTCKAERIAKFADTIRLLVQSWNEQSAHVYGELWCVSTDGNAVFRNGCHQECTIAKLDARDPIAKHLWDLTGLNLAVGPQNLTYSSDPKHCLKRIATLLRSKDGVMVKCQVINRGHLQHFLEQLEHEDKESIRILIDPADHQNVPRAIKLFQAIDRLSGLDREAMAPLDEKVFASILVLREVINSIVHPFIIPTLALSQQLSMLSKFGHLLFALHQLHGTSFISNQLYADLQGIVKTAYFCAAKQKTLDASKPFYLYQLGTDRLEEVFAELRTLSHDVNMDAKQLSENLTNVVQSTIIYSRHPEWKQTQRRTSYSGSEGSDHLNPRYFSGDLISAHVDLATAWKAGRSEAESVLRLSDIIFDFSEALRGADVDFLRPSGDGAFVGMSADGDPVQDQECLSDLEPDDGDIVSDKSKSTGSDPVKAEDGLDLDDFLIDSPEEDGGVLTSHDVSGHWISVPDGKGNDKSVHTASLVAEFFNSGCSKPSADRLLRVRCYQREWKAEETEPAYIGENTFQVLDKAACVIRLGELMVPVIIGVTKILRRDELVQVIGLSELQQDGSGVSVVGQIFAMEDGGEFAGARCWIWTGEYARLQSKAAVSSIPSGGRAVDGLRNDHTIEVPGHVVTPVNLASEAVSSLPDNMIKRKLIKLGQQTTYRISHDTLADIISTSFEPLEPAKYQKFRDQGLSASLPYRLCHDGNDELSAGNAYPTQLLVKEATRALAEKKIGDKIQCYQCGELIKHEEARAHVGEHALLAVLGFMECGLKEQIANIATACGFCGRDSQVEPCGRICMKVTAKKTDIISDCRRQHKFSMGHARVPSQRQPSTNIPIACKLCRPDRITSLFPCFWKYGIYIHIKTDHPNHWDQDLNQPRDLPDDLAGLLEISQEEINRVKENRQKKKTLDITKSMVTGPLFSLPWIAPPPKSSAPRLPLKRAAAIAASSSQRQSRARTSRTN
ncbi:hypothetical protein HGRIS_006714 [Hohenbuehelia grisea]|uniref:C2H2-type domain-containing protein n=1 Tax=Hohenbuehelia grisea TaxID=104357 RepID=A0ABR3J9T7_9AGAR